MSAALKAFLIIAFFSLVVALLALLPTTADYPLPPSITTGIVTFMGYYFAWAKVFTFLNTLFFFFVLTLFLDIYTWTAKLIMWIIGIVARFVG